MSAIDTPARPRLLLPAILTIAGTLVLCVLGIWQLERMGEKHAFIERLTTQAMGQPVPVPASSSWAALDPAKLDLTHVTANGSFVDGPVAGVRTTIAAGPPGTRQLSGFGRWIFQGFKLEDGGTILVNRGFVPESRFSEIKPATGPAKINGFLRAPEARNSFTPADLPANREFYTRDPGGIAASLALPPAPFYLEAERQGDGLTPPAGVDVKELIERIPDNHLQYALTWFGLALTLIGVFTAFAWQGRRKPATGAP
ncbi:SURF1 family protein [Bosea caraganae]|uniref:SURF1-like protein n=1 Tax=Bosea caraganae TaxID=2763117 RepID=A0A370L434_9HYPH|nr:SURF1 family cytochrome oxidase biogenesis protein [Bosea caraganae]RDJ23633.1 SURF1 family protein [Bosea caraganae]RDJ24449.1 SURF1 family protein [Bosea caraganae]